MIDVTDEMVQAYYRAATEQAHRVAAARRPAEMEGSINRAGLAAVLAIVERDHTVAERVQTRCGAAGPDRLTCQRSPDHGTNHAASDGDGLAQW